MATAVGASLAPEPLIETIFDLTIRRVNSLLDYIELTFDLDHLNLVTAFRRHLGSGRAWVDADQESGRLGRVR